MRLSSVFIRRTVAAAWIVTSALAVRAADPRAAADPAAVAGAELAEPREIPNRYELPPLRAAEEGASVSPSTSFEELRRIIETPPTTRHRLDAVSVWADAINQRDRDFGAAISKSGDLVADFLFDKRDEPLFRRYVIFMIFGTASGTLRDYIVQHWDEPRWRTSWRAINTLRNRALRDADPRLAEFFERYQPLPSPPDWRAIKAANRRLQQRLLREYPGKAQDLTEIWKLMESIESSQSRARGILVKRLPAKAGRYAAATADYRTYCTWGVLYPRSVREAIGPEAAARSGVKVYPVKLGWPNYPL